MAHAVLAAALLMLLWLIALTLASLGLCAVVAVMHRRAEEARRHLPGWTRGLPRRPFG